MSYKIGDKDHMTKVLTYTIILLSQKESDSETNSQEIEEAPRNWKVVLPKRK